MFTRKGAVYVHFPQILNDVLIGNEAVQHVQIDLVAKRLSSLMSELQSLERNGTNGRSNKEYNKARTTTSHMYE